MRPTALRFPLRTGGFASPRALALLGASAALAQNILIDESGQSNARTYFPSAGGTVNETIQAAVPAASCGISGAVTPCVYVISNGGASVQPPFFNPEDAAPGGAITIVNPNQHRAR